MMGRLMFSGCRLLLLPVLVVFTACASTSSPAPVTDHSSTLERQTAVIAPPGGGGPAPAPRGGGRDVVSAGSTDDSMLPGQSGTVVSSGVATVRGVDIGGGIARRRIGEEAAPASSASAPAQARSDVRSAATQMPTHHVVNRGDTLYSIAWMYNMDYRRLAVANDLAAPYTIYPNQRLTLNQSRVSDSELRALPDIPAAPAGSRDVASGERPRAAVESRRTGNTPTRQVDGVRWQWPGDGRLLGGFSRDGSRGIDLSASRGSPVYAAADGDVVYAGRGIQGAGNLLILRHSARHLSAYMYNSGMVVREGDRVRAGDKIAESGTHPDGRELLHFEVRVDGQAADPSAYLPQR